jgi:hypothetical protein
MTRPLLDYNGVVITVGCRVRQRNVYDPDLGARVVNAHQEGSVVGLARDRADVQFDGRTAIRAFRSTDEPRVDRVHAKYLEVLT